MGESVLRRTWKFTEPHCKPLSLLVLVDVLLLLMTSLLLVSGAEAGFVPVAWLFAWLGFFFAQCSLLSLWLVLASNHWSGRLPWVLLLLGLNVIAASKICADFFSFMEIEWWNGFYIPAMNTLAPFLVLQVLWLVRVVTPWRINNAAEPSMAGAGRKSQFGLKRLFLWVTLCALFMVVLRASALLGLGPFYFDLQYIYADTSKWEWYSLALTPVLALVVLWPYRCHWSAAVGTAICLLLVALVILEMRPWVPLADWNFYQDTVFPFRAAHLATTWLGLLALRGAGYRLTRQRVRPVKIAASRA